MMDIETAKFWWKTSSLLVRKKEHAHIKNDVITSTDFLPENSSMTQRLWHIIHATQEIPGCRTCGDKVSWDRRNKEYKKYCGNPRCPNIDPQIIEIKKNKTDYDKAAKKRKETNLEKYGTTNFLASDLGKSKVRQKFNDQPTEKKKQRYKTATETRKETILKKYGADNISLLNLSNDTIAKLNDKEWLFNEHYVKRKNLTQIANELNISRGATTVGRYLKRIGLDTLNPIPVSTGEIELRQFLDTLEVEYITNTRSEIAPYELDIFIPSNNLAIEYCGLYWHSEQQGRDRNYHKNKTNRCEQKGIQLLTIYEDEWKQRNVQVKQKISSLLNKDVRPHTYARKTNLVDVDAITKKEFFNDYHIQGDGPSSINIGLEYENEIIAIMGFIKQKNGVFYLNRYATSHRVPGGFSKLLSHFMHNYEWTKIISFADKRWSMGNLYHVSGWNLVKTLPPDYYYSPDGHTRFHKFNYRRNRLPDLLKNFDKTLSERINCDNDGILRIWDCGKLKFELKNET